MIAIERGSYGNARPPRPRPALPVATCGSAAFDLGIGKLELLSRCGGPVSRDIRTQVRTVSLGDGAEADLVTTIVELEIWTYNLGPDQQLATFEGGKLVKVERGSYGFSP